MVSFKLYLWDIGTNGLAPDNHALTTLAAIEYCKSPQLFETSVSPWNDTRSSSLVPGIQEAFEDFRDFIWETCPRGQQPLLVSHYAPFDTAFLAAELDRAGINYPNWRFACSLQLARDVLPKWRSHSQSTLAQRLHVHVGKEHRADDDVRVLRAIVQKLEKNHEGGDVAKVLAENSTSLAAMAQYYYDRTTFSYVTSSTASQSSVRNPSRRVSNAFESYEEVSSAQSRGSRTTAVPKVATTAGSSSSHVKESTVSTKGKRQIKRTYIKTGTGKCYHLDCNCKGLENARELIKCTSIPTTLRPCALCCNVDDDASHAASEVMRASTLVPYDKFYKTKTGKRIHSSRDCKSVKRRYTLECDPMSEEMDPCQFCSGALFQEWKLYGLLYNN